jgi:hypothetical protein
MKPRSARGPFAALLVFVTVVLLGAFPNARATIVQISVLALLALAMSELASRALPRPEKKAWLLDGPLREPQADSLRPNDLVELEHALAWRSYEPREFRNRVRPILRDLIAGRLGGGPGVPASLLPVTDEDADIPARINTQDITRLVDEIEAL